MFVFACHGKLLGGAVLPPMIRWIPVTGLSGFPHTVGRDRNQKGYYILSSLAVSLFTPHLSVPCSPALMLSFHLDFSVSCTATSLTDSPTLLSVPLLHLSLPLCLSPLVRADPQGILLSAEHSEMFPTYLVNIWECPHGRLRLPRSPERSSCMYLREKRRR